MLHRCVRQLYADDSQGANRDTRAAASWYGRASLNGNEEAVAGLISVTRNRSIQRQHLESAALAGNGAAMYQL